MIERPASTSQGSEIFQFVTDSIFSISLSSLSRITIAYIFVSAIVSLLSRFLFFSLPSLSFAYSFALFLSFAFSLPLFVLSIFSFSFITIRLVQHLFCRGGLFAHPPIFYRRTHVYLRVIRCGGSSELLPCSEGSGSGSLRWFSASSVAVPNLMLDMRRCSMLAFRLLFFTIDPFVNLASAHLQCLLIGVKPYI